MTQISPININAIFDKFCRICNKTFNDNKSLISMFKTESEQQAAIKFIEKFHHFFEITKDDGLPQNICLNCLDEFNLAYDLIIKCEKTQEILKTQFKKLNEFQGSFEIVNDILFEPEEYIIDSVEVCDEEEYIEDNNYENEILYEAEILDYNEDEIKIKEENIPIIFHQFEKENENNDNKKILIQNSEIKPYVCLICYREFRTISIRDKHMALELCKPDDNNDTKIFEYGSDNDSNLIESKTIIPKRNKKSVNRNYNCIQCYHSFDQYSEFIEHKKSHANEKYFTGTKKNFLCDICGKDFIKKQSLEDHENVHKGLRPYSCHLCDKSFTFKQILKSHIAKHAENLSYNCLICNKTFTSKQYFLDHKKRHETGVLLPNCDKLFKCPHCPKSFKMLSTLTSHCSFHSKPIESKYNCPNCGAIFKRSDHLKEHINAVHLNIKPFSCDLCGKKFVTGAHRNAHKRKFHSGKRFKCNFCEKDFSLNTSLTRHIRIHTGDKRYKCEICNESFMAVYQIEKHLETHQIDEHFKNELIDRTYANIQKTNIVEIIEN